MRRRTALVAVALLATLAAACGGQDDVEGSEEPVVTDGVDQAVEIAQLSLPVTVEDALAADLVEALCDAAGSGSVDPVVAQLQASGLEPADVDALAAGAGTYCPDDVDDVVPQVQQAMAPTTTAATVAPSTAAAGGTGTRSTAGATSSGSSSSGSSGSISGSGGTSSSSSGSASAGGGNASGTGNSSSTDFTQGAGGSSASNSSTTG